MPWPKRLTLNAWTGKPPDEMTAREAKSPQGEVSPEALGWSLGGTIAFKRFLLPEPVEDLTKWSDPRVGWGLVLAERDGQPDDELLTNSDAPAKIHELLAARPGSPVFRYRRNAADPFNLLRNYKAGKDVTLSGSARGTADDAIPYYLLIYGTPADVPWELQYILNTNHCVGRLDLTGDALANYVDALIDGWPASQSQPLHALVWATNYGGGDITELMRNAIAEPLADKYAKDKDLSSVFLDGLPASRDALAATLAAKKPGLIVTTSHGQTGPLDQPAEMKAKLGLPVDSGFRALDLDALLKAWEPDGAIWYAHACCSAGCDGHSTYEGLLDPSSEAARTLSAVAGLGSQVAPLPRALLGAKKPIRAFIGHVEPTFDWTLTQPLTGQYLTSAICKALYEGLYNRQPVGLAFREWYERMGPLFTEYDRATQEFNKGRSSEERLLYYRLSARDVGTTVILGDPTALIPVPANPT